MTSQITTHFSHLSDNPRGFFLYTSEHSTQVLKVTIYSGIVVLPSARFELTPLVHCSTESFWHILSTPLPNPLLVYIYKCKATPLFKLSVCILIFNNISYYFILFSFIYRVHKKWNNRVFFFIENTYVNRKLKKKWCVVIPCHKHMSIWQQSNSSF